MKIIHLASSKRWTGVAEPMVNLAFYQKALGHEVWIGCERGRSLERRAGWLGQTVLKDMRLTARSNPFVVYQDIKSLRNYINEIQPDVIHCHLLHDHWVSAFSLKKDTRKPLLVRTLHRYKRPYADPFHSWLYRKKTSLFIVPSGAMKKLVLEKHPSLKKRLHVVYGGINQQRFHPQNNPDRARNICQVPKDAPFAGIVSRLRGDRNLDWFMEALPAVLKNLPDSRFVIAGRGEIAEELNSKIQEPPYKGRVVMPGYFTKSLSNLYAAMDVSIFLAQGSEGSCRAVMEAMASGTPVIGLREGVVPEIIEHGKSGWIVESRNVADLAKYLIRALSDNEKTGVMGKAARKRMEDKFNLLTMAEEVIRIYQSHLD